MDSDATGGENRDVKEAPVMSWVYEARLYDSKSVASYVAMCVRDDHLLQGHPDKSIKVQVFRTRRGNYGIRYRRS